MLAGTAYVLEESRLSLRTSAYDMLCPSRAAELIVKDKTYYLMHVYVVQQYALYIVQRVHKYI